MNRISKYPFLWLAILLVTCASCGEDRSGEYVALTQKDRWIEQQIDVLHLFVVLRYAKDKRGELLCRTRRIL